LSVTYDRSVVSSTNKTDRHDITEILLKVALITIILHLPNMSHLFTSSPEGEFCIWLVSYNQWTPLSERFHTTTEKLDSKYIHCTSDTIKQTNNMCINMYMCIPYPCFTYTTLHSPKRTKTSTSCYTPLVAMLLFRTITTDLTSDKKQNKSNWLNIPYFVNMLTRLFWTCLYNIYIYLVLV